MKNVLFLFFFTFLIFIFSTCQRKNMDFIITIATPLGNMEVLLYEETPQHKANFLKLANEKFYDGVMFHRIIKNFMIQGGDPYSKTGEGMVGTGGPGYTIPAEIKPQFGHKKGALAAARQGDQVNPQRASSGSQFYIVHSANGTKHLDGQYTVFGEVVSGLDIIDKIAQAPTASGDRPVTDIPMTLTIRQMKKKEITEKYGFKYPEEVK